MNIIMKHAVKIAAAMKPAFLMAQTEAYEEYGNSIQTIRIYQ